MSNFHIYKVINYRAYDLQDPSGYVSCTAVADIHSLIPPEYIHSTLPTMKKYMQRFCFVIDGFSLRMTSL